MTRGELRGEILRRWNDAGGQTIRPEDINAWLDQANREIMKKTRCILTTASASVVTDQVIYDFYNDFLVDNVVKVTSVLFNNKPIDETTIDLLDNTDEGWRTATSESEPTQYVKWGEGSIKINPPGNSDASAYDLTIEYVPSPDLMTDDNTSYPYTINTARNRNLDNNFCEPIISQVLVWAATGEVKQPGNEQYLAILDRFKLDLKNCTETTKEQFESKDRHGDNMGIRVIIPRRRA